MVDPIINNPRAMRKLTKAKLIMIITDLNESFISAKQRLYTANLKLAMARVTIADKMKELGQSRQALQVKNRKIKSLGKTLTRRRKVKGKGRSAQYEELEYLNDKKSRNGNS